MSAPRLNFPYSGGGGGGISGSGTAGRVAKFTGGTAVGDSLIRDNGTDVAIDSVPAVGYKFTVNGDTTIAGRIDALTGSINTVTSRPSTDLALQRDTVTAATIKAGSIATVTAATPAATTGNYANLAITATSGSMSGTGATADIVVVGGFVTSVTIRAPGNDYVLGATLTAASLPGLSPGATIATITAVILEIEGAANIMTSGRLAAGTTNGTEQLTVSAGSADRIAMNVVGSVSTLTFGSTNSTGAIRTIAYDRGGASWTFNYGNNPGPLSAALTIDNSGVASFGGPVRATGTAATAPAFTGSDTDTGMYFPANNQVRLSTNGSFALAVDASQRVGIGQATPTAPLHVLGTSITAASTTTASAGIHRIEGSASNALFVGSFSDSPFGMCLQTNSTSYPLVLQPAGGSVGVNVTSPATNTLDVSAAGWGVKLPATPGNGNGNTLDCYAESTWTPTLSGFTGTAPQTVTGTYTRIGRVVVYTVVADNTSGTWTNPTWGSALITNIPFAPSVECAVPIALGDGIGSGYHRLTPTVAVVMPVRATAASYFRATWTIIV